MEPLHLENKLKRYIQLTVRGIRADYYKKLSRQPMSVSPQDLYMFYDEPYMDTDLHKYYIHLTQRERDVMVLHFNYGYTQVEVGRILNISQQAVTANKTRALTRLRCKIEGDLL